MRHCCLCRKQCGTNIEAAHIIDEASGGSNEEDNGIPLCFDCHQEVGAYRDSHPKGNKFRPDELRHRRDAVYELVRTGSILKQEPLQSPTTVYNVSSTGQMGGITAAVVNMGKPPRVVDDGHKRDLLHYLPDKSRLVTVRAVMGDSEALSFAAAIRDYLLGQGYNVPYLGQAVFSDVKLPQHVDLETYTVTIGSQR
jgi:hypothetical protein